MLNLLQHDIIKYFVKPANVSTLSLYFQLLHNQWHVLFYLFILS
jgi:hypothetical protein